MKWLLSFCLVGLVEVAQAQQTSTCLRFPSTQIPKSVSIGDLAVRNKAGEHPIWGTLSQSSETICFAPRVPLQTEQDYVLFLKQGGRLLASVYLEPEARAVPTPKLLAFYPHELAVPENLLRLQLKFSTSMRKGEALQHISLVDDATGDRVSGVFRDMKYELWDDDQTSLTLYFHPARIKTGLRANQEMGMALKPGKSYRLVVSKDWQDIYGNRLGFDYLHVLEIQEADRIQPDEAEISFGEKDGQLYARFGDQMNVFQVIKSLTVFLGNQRLNGQWSAQSSSLFEFRSDAPLTRGTYTLQISSEIEDISGNSFRKAFEEPHLTKYKSPFTIEKKIVLPVNYNRNVYPGTSTKFSSLQHGQPRRDAR